MSDEELIREAHAALRRYGQTKREADDAYSRARASIRELARGDYAIAVENGISDDIRGRLNRYLRSSAKLECRTVGEQIKAFIEDKDREFADLALLAWGINPCD